MKFLRTYSMLAQGQTGTHQIDFPLTCRFQVTNDNTFTSGSATLQVVNLAKEVRADLYKDPLEILDYKQVIFSAGYQMEPSSHVAIFRGNIIQCYSYRQGPDWITEIQAMDGGHMIDTANINLSMPSGYTLRYATQMLVNSMSPTVQLGLIGSLITSPIANTRGLTLSGNPWDLLVRQCTGRGLVAFIYQEKAYVVTQNEYRAIAGAVTEISTETGMLGSPRIQAFQVMADMLFEPRIEVQQQIQLKTSQNRMSGHYLVNRVVHRGTISQASCEDLRTHVTLYRSNIDALQAAA